MHGTRDPFSAAVFIVAGIAAGGQPIAGFNCGAGKYDRVRSTYRLVAYFAAVAGATAMLLFELFPPDAHQRVWQRGRNLYQVCCAVLPLLFWRHIAWQDPKKQGSCMGGLFIMQ